MGRVQTEWLGTGKRSVWIGFVYPDKVGGYQLYLNSMKLRPQPVNLDVTQTGSLPYRRLATCTPFLKRTACRLPVGDTADCQSALRLGGERQKRPHTRIAWLLALVFIAFALITHAEAKTQVLVVTGGHGFEKEPFYKMFSDNP